MDAYGHPLSMKVDSEEFMQQSLAGIGIRKAQKRKKGSAAAYLSRNWFLYLLALPGFIYLFIFRYSPIYGVLIAFKDYKVRLGIWNSPWVGLENFKILFQDEYFYKVLANTVWINVLNIFFCTIFTVFLALLLNEMLSTKIKRIVQTAVYLPNFLSWVVFGGLVIIFLSPSEGPVNKIITALGGKSVYFLIQPQYFKAILVITTIIKSAGFGTIIYLSSLAGIDPGLYESAVIDGANRFHAMKHITLPRLYPTIAVMVMLDLANIFSSNFEQVFTLYNPLVYDTGDVLSTYLYRSGMLEGKFEMSTALSFVFNVVSLLTILGVNKVISRSDVVGVF